MGDERLTPAQKAEYKFLNQEVNRLQDEWMSRDARPDVQQRLQRARDELREFVRGLENKNER